LASPLVRRSDGQGCRHRRFRRTPTAGHASARPCRAWARVWHRRRGSREALGFSLHSLRRARRRVKGIHVRAKSGQRWSGRPSGAVN